MSTFLWALLLTVTFNHGLRLDPVQMKRGRQDGRQRNQQCEQGFLPWTAPLTALMMLLATGFHLRCREEPQVWVSLILFGLAAILAYGSWMVSPF